MKHRDHADSNAAELYAALEHMGYVVRRIATAVQRTKGIPDSIVGRKGDPQRRTHLLEVKRLGARGLSEAQIAFIAAWPGCVHVATSSWQADLLLKECEQRLAEARR